MLFRLLGLITLFTALAPDHSPVRVASARAGDEAPPPGFFIKSEPVPIADGVETSFDVIQIPVSTGDAEGLGDAQAWINRDLAEAKRLDPAVNVRVLLAKDVEDATLGNQLEDFTAGIHAQAEVEKLPEHWTRNVRGVVKDWTLDHSRGIFTLVRGSMNGSVFAWTLMMTTQMPAHIALPLGLVVGGLNSGFFYVQKTFNETMAQFKKVYPAVKDLDFHILPLVRNPTLAEIREQLTKRFYKISLMTSAKLALFSLGYGTDTVGGLTAVAGRAITSSGLSGIAQAFWDLDIGHRVAKLSRAHPERANRYRLVGELKKTALTTISLTLSVSYFLKVPYAEAGLLFLGAGGATQYFLQIRQEWNQTEALSSKSLVGRCKSLLRRKTDGFSEQ